MKKQIDGVTVDAQSIVTSLKIIQTVCEDNFKGNGDCAKACPLGYGDCTCCVNDLIPANWKINSSAPVWKALL